MAHFGTRYYHFLLTVSAARWLSTTLHGYKTNLVPQQRPPDTITSPLHPSPHQETRKMSAIRSDSLEGVVSVSGHEAFDEKTTVDVIMTKEEAQVTTTSICNEDEGNSEDAIIITGADAAAHLLPMRDDGDPALTFRSLVLASVLACFQSVMYQIYQVCTSPSCLNHTSADRCAV
jgi:hypothetical protein